MLSHHEISALLLVQRAPYQVEAKRHDLATLERKALVEIEQRKNGARIARLTQRGVELLRKLNKTVDQQARAGIRRASGKRNVV